MGRGGRVRRARRARSRVPSVVVSLVLRSLVRSCSLLRSRSPAVHPSIARSFVTRPTSGLVSGFPVIVFCVLCLLYLSSIFLSSFFRAFRVVRCPTSPISRSLYQQCAYTVHTIRRCQCIRLGYSLPLLDRLGGIFSLCVIASFSAPAFMIMVK